MKVVIINKHVEDIVGGSEIQCDIIANGLTKLGHDITYLSIDGKKNNYNTNYNVIRVEGRSKTITDIVIKLSPDIVYWRTYRYLYKGLKELLKKGIITVYALSAKYDVKPMHAFIVNKNKIKALKEFLILKKQFGIIKKVDGVTTLNPDYFNLIPNRTKRIVLNAMVVKHIPFAWGNPYCVWVANHRETKRPELYVELSKRLKNIGVDFLMIGRASPNYKWIISGEDLPKSFHYLGEKTVEEVNGILSSSLFHIHTCHPEGFGNVFIQAWLNKKPSISLGFDPGGFIEKHQIGFNANNDFDLFVEKVKEYIENEELRNLAGERAYNFAKLNFTPDVLAKNVESFLLEVLESKK